MKHAVPFKVRDEFSRAGIDWSRPAPTKRERAVRESFLTYERTCGPNGLVSLVLLALAASRSGDVADDLRDAAELAEGILSMKLRVHQIDVLEMSWTRVHGDAPTHR